MSQDNDVSINTSIEEIRIEDNDDVVTPKEILDRLEQVNWIIS